MVYSRLVILFTSLIGIAGCNDQANNSVSDARKPAPARSTEKPVISERRLIVKKEAIAEYKVRTDNPLNDWYFQVQLFETPQTFKYLLTFQYEEIRGQDTLQLPDLGTEPKPVIRKGDEKYSCIVGFIDNNGEYREYKKVFVQDNTLKVKALKHYAVTTR